MPRKKKQTGEHKRPQPDRLRPLRLPLPLEEALEGAIQVPPPEDDEQGDKGPSSEEEDEQRPR